MEQIILPILMIALMVIIGVVQNSMVKAYRKKLDEHYHQDFVVFEYCLTFILHDSIKKEDYETAQRCRDLLAKMKAANKPKKSANGVR